MNTFAHSVKGVTHKLGLAGAGKIAGLAANSTLVKLLLLLLLLPVGSVLLVVLFGVRRMTSWLRKMLSWMVAKPLLALLLLASGVWLGFGIWVVNDRWQARRLSIAVGARTSDSHRLGQALQAVTTAHYPRLRLAMLEIEEAAGNGGVMENGVVQLAIASSDSAIGPNARSVATLTGTPPQVLLARYDVDEEMVFALTRVLTQFGQELTPANPAGNTASPPSTSKTDKSKAKNNVLVHPGAAAFYDWGKTSFVVRYAKLLVFVAVGLVLLALWIGQFRRRPAQHQPQVQANRFAPPILDGPWTFSRILLENLGETSAPRSGGSSHQTASFRQRLFFRTNHGK